MYKEYVGYTDGWGTSLFHSLFMVVAWITLALFALVTWVQLIWAGWHNDILRLAATCLIGVVPHAYLYLSWLLNKAKGDD